MRSFGGRDLENRWSALSLKDAPSVPTFQGVRDRLPIPSIPAGFSAGLLFSCIRDREIGDARVNNVMKIGRVRL